jgi:hypothetical protein
MDVITIDSQAYKELVSKINLITKFVISYQEKESENVTEGWVDSYDVCTFLNVSARTLQRLRAEGAVNYSRIRGKNFYKLREIKRLMDERVIRSTDECFQDLIKNCKFNVEQR